MSGQGLLIMTVRIKGIERPCRDLDHALTESVVMFKRMFWFFFCIGGFVVVFDAIVAAGAFWEYYDTDPVRDTALISGVDLPPTARANGQTVILVHGLNGSPLDFDPLIPELRRAGYRVVAPLMPAQTRDVLIYDRGDYSFEDYDNWLAAIIAEHGHGKRKPILIGISMGGTLACLQARRGTIEKLVLLAPFFALHYGDALVRRLSGLIHRIVPVLPKMSAGQINDPLGRSTYRPGSYFISMAVVHHLMGISERARLAIDDILVPMLAIASRGDKVASFDATAQAFRERHGVEWMPLTHSNHLLLYDQDRNEVMGRILAFLETKR